MLNSKNPAKNTTIIPFNISKIKENDASFLFPVLSKFVAPGFLEPKVLGSSYPKTLDKIIEPLIEPMRYPIKHKANKTVYFSIKFTF